MTDTILLIDDDPAFVEEMTGFLELHGLRVAATTDPTQVMALLREIRPQILLLDQMLGPVSGIDVLRSVRTESNVACIILTAMQDPVDRILGLELGADDYIHKTAMPREILARVRAVLRRVTGNVLVPPVSSAAGEAGWDLRVQERELYAPDGSRCYLTGAEFNLLRMLTESPGTPISRDVLTERVYGRPYRINDRAIDSLVWKLRRKLEPNPDAPIVIKSVRQQGYVFSGFAPSQAMPESNSSAQTTLGGANQTKVDTPRGS